MSTIEIHIGQVWRDKDKRRNTTIEIINVGYQGTTKLEEGEVVGLVVGTEQERIYQSKRLIDRWELVAEKLIEEGVPTNKAAPKPKHKTREQWLIAAIEQLTKKVFTPNDFEVPAVRVSVGWPGGRGKKQGVIGQCFATKSATDKVSQIFVSPVVSDALNVVVVLAHELVHAVDDCQSGHKKDFVRIAREIGFTPKWTVATTDTITDTFKEQLQKIADSLGAYPHAAIHATERPQVQKTYMLKIVPSEDCNECDPEYKIRMTEKWLEDGGAPLCPHGIEMEVEG